jgi:hypothetical protein
MGHRTIKASAIVSDIRSGVSDFELMAKYDLSLSQLEKVLQELVKGGAMRRAELDERGPFYDEPCNRLLTRSFSRAYLRIPLSIEDRDDPANGGLIIDLSEHGFRVRGIAIAEDEEKKFLIPAQEVGGVAQIELIATCIWVLQDGRERKLWEAGLKITRISAKGRSSIRRLIKVLSFGDCNIMRRKCSAYKFPTNSDTKKEILRDEKHLTEVGIVEGK